MWELDHKEGWSLNWWFWIVVLEKTLESPLDSKEITAVNSKENWPWIYIGRTNAEGEASIIWSPDAKSQIIGKNPDAMKDWEQEEKGATENEKVGWHQLLNRHEFEQTFGDSERKWSLACYSSWGCKEWTWLSDWTRTTNTKEKSRTVANPVMISKNLPCGKG